MTGGQQRWARVKGRRPTIATALAVQIPYDEPDAAVDVVLEGIVAKNAGSGVTYFNAYVETRRGLGKNSEWGALVAYKRPIAGELALFGDLLYQRGGLLTLELSTEVSFGRFALGPGVSFGTNLTDGNKSASSSSGRFDGWCARETSASVLP